MSQVITKETTIWQWNRWNRSPLLPDTCAGGRTVNPLLDSLRTGSEAVTVDNFSFLIERAVMGPDISEVDTESVIFEGPPPIYPRVLFTFFCRCSREQFAFS